MECSDCMAWNRLENQPEWGECRRHAPSPRTGPDSSAIYGPFNLRGIWPYTRAVDFCHEYLEYLPLGLDEDGTLEAEDPGVAVPQDLNPNAAPSARSFESVVEQATRIAMQEEDD